MAAAFRAAQAAAVTMPFSLPPAAPTSPALTSIAALQAAALQAALGVAVTGPFSQLLANDIFVLSLYRALFLPTYLSFSDIHIHMLRGREVQ